MGKATRWLKGLLGGKKDNAGNEKRKDLEKTSGKERRREPVVAVRGHRRSGRRSSVHGEGLEVAAAVRIQSVFRGFLARKALRALKALVKLQAMVRGFLVRKQTAAALQSMQALIRAQTLVLNRRSRVLPCREQGCFHPDYHPRRSIDKCDGSYNSPKIVEIDMNRPKPRIRRTNPCACDSGDEFFTSPEVPQLPPRMSIPRSKNMHEQEWYLMADECRLSTVQRTPRLLDPSGFVTPSRSIRGVDSGLPHCPSYMANTQSFNAKLRSQSAPRQRPDSPTTRRKSNASEAAEELRRRSCSQAPEGLGAPERSGYASVGSIENEAMTYYRRLNRRL